MVIGSSYRPPGSAALVVQHMREYLENIFCQFPSNVIVLGEDFILPDVVWETNVFKTCGRDRELSNIVLSAVSKNYLEQLNRAPPHGDNVLDLLVINRCKLFRQSVILRALQHQ